MSNAPRIFFDYKGQVRSYNLNAFTNFKLWLQKQLNFVIDLSKIQLFEVTFNIDENTSIKFISDNFCIIFKDGRAVLHQFSVEFAYFPLNTPDNPYKLDVLPLGKKYNL